jgi:hypothetical protein
MGAHSGSGLPECGKTSCNAECSCDGLPGPWEFCDPRRDETEIPYTDPDTVALIDEAVDDLDAFRCPLGRGDAGAILSCLVSLIDEAQSRMWDAVADARDQDYTWDEIADRLAGTARSVRRRYAAYTRWRTTLGEQD